MGMIKAGIKLFSGMGDLIFMKGVFYGVGVGPGDPELLTLKGYRVLREVDVICAPKSGADREGVALSIIGEIIGQKKEVLELSFPMTRERAKLEPSWEKAAGRIIGFLREGKKVAFVTLGDPTLYSTYTYLLKKIKQAGPWAVETIPGVPSFCACAALAGIPLAEGEEKLAVVPVIEDLDTVRFVCRHFENVVFMKVAGKFAEVAAVLEELGLKGQAVFASRCGLAGSVVKRDLEEVEEGHKDYLSLIIVKKVAQGG